MIRKRTIVLATLGALALCCIGSGVAWAQADTLKVNYYINAGAPGFPDGTLEVTNPGTSGGNLCASIYVFDPAEELKECCSCLVTPDGLLTLSVNKDLTNNPQNGVHSSTGAIKIVSSAPGSNGRCAAAVAENPVPTPSLRAWITHPRTKNTVTQAGTVTEEEFDDATLSSAELASLKDLCDTINDNGSGRGLCATKIALCQ